MMKYPKKYYEKKDKTFCCCCSFLELFWPLFMSHLTLDGGGAAEKSYRRVVVYVSIGDRERPSEQTLLLTMQMPTILCLSIEFIASFPVQFKLC